MVRRRGSAGSRVKGFDPIPDMAVRLGVAAAVKERAKGIFREMEEAKAWPRGPPLLADRSKVTLYAAACLSIACRSEGSPRTLKDLASAASAAACPCPSAAAIFRMALQIRRRLGGEDEGGAGQGTGVGLLSASSYLRRFGTRLGLGEPGMAAAEAAARRLEESGIDVRHNAQSVAAGIIYMAAEGAGVRVTYKGVGAAVGVTGQTIGAVCRKLRPHAQRLFGYSASVLLPVRAQLAAQYRRAPARAFACCCRPPHA